MSVELRPGVKVKNYTLERQLGKGASGEVWKAYDSQKTVAIKFMNENLMSSPSAAKHRVRLEREVEAMRRLQHPNIPTLFDYDFDFPRPYIAMRFVGGDSYDKLIANGDMLRVPLTRRLELIRELAFALEAAHDYGIVHRDIKPSNLTGIENPFLLDFSVALEREEVDMTQRFIGTTLYMSPDTEADRLSDNYGFALVTYEILFGKHPIYRPGDQIFNQIIAKDRLEKGEWRWPSRIPLAELPQDLRPADLRRLDEIFNLAMGKRETRYKDLRDFARDLRDAIFPEMKTVVPQAEQDYVPTMMMPAIPVTPPPTPAPAPAPTAPAPVDENAGTMVMPAIPKPAPAPPPPAQKPEEYDARTVPAAEHKTTPFASLENAPKTPPDILRTEVETPFAPGAPAPAPAAPDIQRTELETPAAPPPPVQQPAAPAQPNYTMMEFQSAAPPRPPQAQQGESYTMMEFQSAAPPRPPQAQQGESYTMMEFQSAAPRAPQQGQPTENYTMMEFKSAGQPGQPQPANPNYTMMQMQVPPAGLYSAIEKKQAKSGRSPLLIILIVLVIILILVVIAAVALIASGTITIN